ncbi:MAG: hypothetical protein R3A44_06135 [Caldilineaceae bacterium]
MYTSQPMNLFIQQMVEKFAPDATSSTNITLTLAEHGYLVMEEIVPGATLRLAHLLYARGSDLLCNPEVFFWLQDNEWIPYAINYTMIGWRGYAQYDPLTNTLIHLNFEGQRTLAQEIDALAHRCRNVGWLRQGRIAELPGNLALWPEPTEPQPDDETLIYWFNDAGGCEATDGCWVESDGVCPHGYPSWLVVLGMI